MGRTVTTVVRWVSAGGRGLPSPPPPLSVRVCVQPGRESRLFPLLVLSRVLLVPLLMLCNVQGRAHLPVLFQHDAAFAAIMLLFSVSSGYFVCLSMSYAPQ